MICFLSPLSLSTDYIFTEWVKTYKDQIVKKKYLEVVSTLFYNCVCEYMYMYVYVCLCVYSK